MKFSDTCDFISFPLCVVTFIEMSQASVADHGTYSEIELRISKVGKLGIEFRSTASPYFVINVSAEAHSLYGVQPGDLLLALKKDSDATWKEADGLDWAGLVEVLKHRPARAIFKRFNIGGSNARPSSTSGSPMHAKSPQLHPAAASPSVPHSVAVSDASPVRNQAPSPVRHDIPAETNAKQSIKSPFIQSTASLKPPLPSLSPKTLPIPDKVGTPVRAASPRRPSLQQDPSLVTVVYSTEGPLGLEFEDMDFPYKVGAVRAQSMSADKGVTKGDCLLTVNGKDTQSMSWDDIRTELASRPAIVVFKRDLSTQTPQSVWDLAAGLVRGSSTPESDRIENLRQERDELRAIVSSVGAEDLGTLRQIAMDHDALLAKMSSFEEQLQALQREKETAASLVDEERAKNGKLVDVIDEIEKSQSAVIERFEKEIQERERVIADLKGKADTESAESRTSASTSFEPLKEKVAQLEAKLELMEKDNSRLRKENTDLGVMVQQCLEKLQRDLGDKPHWVDRRVVCSAVATLLKETDAIDPHSETAVDAHLTARQKVGDVLGLTYEERSSIGLLSVAPPRPARMGTDFVSFLERESLN